MAEISGGSETVVEQMPAMQSSESTELEETRLVLSSLTVIVYPPQVSLYSNS